MRQSPDSAPALLLSRSCRPWCVAEVCDIDKLCFAGHFCSLGKSLSLLLVEVDFFFPFPLLALLLFFELSNICFLFF